MSTNKSKFTFYLDCDVECVLSTIAVNFGLSKSKLLEFMIMNAGYNLYGSEGLYNAWFLHYDPRDLIFFTDPSFPANLSDIILSTDALENSFLEGVDSVSDSTIDPAR